MAQIVNNIFMASDAMGDTALFTIHSTGLSVSTQKRDSETPGRICSMSMKDTLALRDWLNKEYPNA